MYIFSQNFLYRVKKIFWLMICGMWHKLRHQGWTTTRIRPEKVGLVNWNDKGSKWRVLSGISVFNLGHVVCEMSIIHLSSYVKLTDVVGFCCFPFLFPHLRGKLNMYLFLWDKRVFLHTIIHFIRSNDINTACPHFTTICSENPHLNYCLLIHP